MILLQASRNVSADRARRPESDTTTERVPTDRGAVRFSSHSAEGLVSRMPRTRTATLINRRAASDRSKERAMAANGWRVWPSAARATALLPRKTTRRWNRSRSRSSFGPCGDTSSCRNRLSSSTIVTASVASALKLSGERSGVTEAPPQETRHGRTTIPRSQKGFSVDSPRPSTTSEATLNRTSRPGV